MPKLRNTALVPKFQAASSLTQAAPVQNTWYTILDTTTNFEGYIATIKVETADETLEVRWTIDGQVITKTNACTFGTTYYVFLDATSTQLGLTITSTNWNMGMRATLQARSMKVELRKTTAAGAGDLKGQVTYSKW